ncbi:MAG: hypothetical protein HRU04_25270 [Oceanospirillaceae bacterium]|nr:hypothetical protein [Oceanospirillaceae bacterium]
MSKVYAHRGGSGYFVENTLKAFEYAIELGCAGAELDVQLSSDGEVVVHHDTKLNPKYTRDINGFWIDKKSAVSIDQLTLREIKSYTIGEPNPALLDLKSWPNILPTEDQTIPTLQEVISLVKEKSNSFELVIELKVDIFATEPKSWQALADKVLSIVEANGFLNRVVFCSFNWNSLLHIQSYNVDVPLWFTTHPLSWLVGDKVPSTDLKPSQNFLDRLRGAWASGRAPWYAGFQPSEVSEFPDSIAAAGGRVWFCYHRDGTSIDTKLHGLKVCYWSANFKNNLDCSNLLVSPESVCVDYTLYKIDEPSAHAENVLGQVHEQKKKKNWTAAVSLMEELICKGRETERIYKEYVFCQRASGDVNASLKCVQTALGMYPNSTALLSELAMIFFVQKKYYESLDLMARVLLMGDRSSEAKKRFIRCGSYFVQCSCGLDKSVLRRVVSVFYSMKMWDEVVNFCSSYNEIFNNDKYLLRMYEMAEGFLGVKKESNNKCVNLALIPGNNALWPVLADLFWEKEINVSLSIDHNPTNIGAVIKSNWPCCQIFNAFDLSKGATLLSGELVHYPDPALLKSKDFFETKLKAFSIMQRQDDEGRFRYLDRDVVFNSIFLFFYNKFIELNVTVVVAGHAPHSPSTFIMAETARLMGIRVFHFIENPVVPLFQITSCYYGSRFPVRGNLIPEYVKNKMFDYIDGVLENDESYVIPDYMRKQREFDAGKNLAELAEGENRVISRLATALDGDVVNLKKGHWQIRNSSFLYTDNIREDGVEIEAIKANLRRKLLKEYKVESTMTPDLDIKYIYYPLHYEPEKTSNPDGGEFWDTYHSVLALRQFVPDDIPIYVKEHYSQFTGALAGYKGKSIYFYKLLASIKNVQLLDYDISSRLLTQHAIAVATKTGTAAFEAAILGRKALLFGYPWFYQCPNVYHIDELNSFEDLLDKPIFSSNDIKAFFENWADEYAIFGAMSGSQRSIAKGRLSISQLKEVDNLRPTARTMVSLINDYLNQEEVNV